MITVFDQNMQAHTVKASEIEAIAAKDHALWIHLEGDDYSDFQEVAEAFDLHHLAIDNIIQPFTRTKISRYEDHILLTTQIPNITGDFRIEFTQVGIFILKDVIITILNKKINYGKDIQERLRDQAEIPERSVDFVLYAILDCIVDDFLKVAELLDEESENLETVLFDDKTPDDSIQKQTFHVHRDLTDLRRVILPMREVMSSILRWEGYHRNVKTTPYFQEVYDHVVLAAEWTDSSRDMASNVLQTQIALQGNALNVTMKKVTSWAAIIAVPAAITGFYGMNVPYPGDGQTWGVVAACAIMLVSCVGLWVIFKKKDWL